MRDGEQVVIHPCGSWEPYDSTNLFHMHYNVIVIGSDDWWKLEAGLRYDIRTFTRV